eukprot:gene7230-9861_t
MADDDSYNDDFSDNDASFMRDHDQDDEQHVQKITGQLEALQMKLDETQQELDEEKHKNQIMKIKYENEIRPRTGNGSSSNANSPGGIMNNSYYEELKNDIEKYKNLCQSLQEKLDQNSSKALEVIEIPVEIRKEIINLNHIFKINNTINDDSLSIKDFISILKSIPYPSTSCTQKSKEKENNLSTTTSQNNNGNNLDLLDRIKSLEDELRLALSAAEDIRALKAKLLQMVERIRVEKEYKLKAEDDLKHSKKKIDMLMDHIEKLMVHMKQEVAVKIRLTEQVRTSEKENKKLNEKYQITYRRSNAKDRFITELREGSRVLEDQLRLMDEKYLELRGKLDYAREQGNAKLNKAERVAKELRMKFALSGHSTLLDNFSLPDIYNNNNGMSTGSQSAPGGGSIFSQYSNNYNNNELYSVGLKSNYSAITEGSNMVPSDDDHDYVSEMSSLPDGSVVSYKNTNNSKGSVSFSSSAPGRNSFK